MRLIKLSERTIVNLDKIEKVNMDILEGNILSVSIYTSPIGSIFTRKFPAWEEKDIEFFKPYITYLIKTGLENDTFQQALSIIESPDTLLKWLVDQIYFNVTDTVIDYMMDEISTKKYKTSVIKLDKTDIYIVFHTCNTITRNELHQLLAKDRVVTYSVDSMEGIYNIKIAKEKHLEDVKIQTDFTNKIVSVINRKVIDKYKY